MMNRLARVGNPCYEGALVANATGLFFQLDEAGGVIPAFFFEALGGVDDDVGFVVEGNGVAGKRTAGLVSRFHLAVEGEGAVVLGAEEFGLLGAEVFALMRAEGGDGEELAVFADDEKIIGIGELVEDAIGLEVGEGAGVGLARRGAAACGEAEAGTAAEEGDAGGGDGSGGDEFTTIDFGHRELLEDR